MSDKDTVYRQAAIDAINSHFGFNIEDEYGSAVQEVINGLPSAQHEPISEEYAKAVRTWLINYQVRCAELKGRYTSYEILGWIVSDWRKENEIW